MWSRQKSVYYLQLEDDVIAKAGYLSFIKNSITRANTEWFMLEFSNLGFIGKLFRSESLSVI